MAELLFWLSAGLVLYAYAGFPLLLLVRSRLCRQELRRAEITPLVSFIVVAHNEATVIRQKLENLLALDYPRDRVSVLVASDGSDDDTEALVEGYAGRGVRLLALPRRGKIPALNAAVAQAAGDILVFSDANSLYAPGALRALVRPFADSAVGGVAGSQHYVTRAGGSRAATGEHAYWNWDQRLKRWQSDAGSVTSATGAIYAIRRALFQPVPGGVGDDALVSYRVVARGYRFVFEPEAVAYEALAQSSRAEFRRKVRVCLRGLRGLLAMPQLLNPFRYGFYSLQLFSHKLLRWLLAWPLIMLLLASLALWPAGPLYQMAALVQVLFYGCALAVYLLLREERATSARAHLLTLPFYFCLANTACLLAQWQLVRGRSIDAWEVQRAAE